MSSSRIRGHHPDDGFTLIELLVVIIIIGILAAVAVPAFLSQRQKGVDATIKADLKSAANLAAQITVDDQASTTPFTAAQLSDAGWRADERTVFTISGTPAGGDFCASGHQEGGTTSTTTQWVYLEDQGGLQATQGSACSGTPTYADGSTP